MLLRYQSGLYKFPPIVRIVFDTNATHANKNCPICGSDDTMEIYVTSTKAPTDETKFSQRDPNRHMFSVKCHKCKKETVKYLRRGDVQFYDVSECQVERYRGAICSFSGRAKLIKATTRCICHHCDEHLELLLAELDGETPTEEKSYDGETPLFRQFWVCEKCGRKEEQEERIR